MKRIAAAALAVMAFAALAGCATQGSGSRPKPPEDVNIDTLPADAIAAAQTHTALGAAVLAAVNDYRAGKGLGRLSPDANLQRIAAVHAADMQIRGFFGHFNPEGQGPRERLLTIDPDFTGRIAENVQVLEGQTYAAMSDTELAATMVGKWVESPMHRKNIKAPEMTESGIGISRRGNRIIVVQVFGAP